MDKEWRCGAALGAFGPLVSVSLFCPFFLCLLAASATADCHHTPPLDCTHSCISSLHACSDRSNTPTDTPTTTHTQTQQRRRPFPCHPARRRDGCGTLFARAKAGQGKLRRVSWRAHTLGERRERRQRVRRRRRRRATAHASGDLSATLSVQPVSTSSSTSAMDDNM